MESIRIAAPIYLFEIHMPTTPDIRCQLDAIEKKLDLFMSEQSMPLYMDYKKASEYFGVSKKMLERLTSAGLIKKYRPSPSTDGKVVLNSEEVERYLRSTIVQ